MHRSLLLFLLPFAALAQSGPPPKAPVVPTDLAPQIETLKPGVKMTLLAEHPALVTPTGIDVDEKGRIWLAACHTHFRPEGYEGPQHDEILVFDADGKNRRVFYNKTDATMHVEVGPDGWIYLAERDRVLRVKDSDGDGVGDTEENLATLDTVADYPHNGLSGMAWHPDGGLVFSLGENFGKDWTLTGTDGAKVSGRGEGGVFRCTADGKGLRRIARGFWNPFGLLVRADGEIFAAENDPGSRPPCRLLNIVEGADYGFQWVYGSAPVHPFVAWNGELRGTLGMVHPSGEGPCAVVELGGGVMIPSWSDHSIDYFPLTRKGAGYTSERIPLVKGSDFFRPVCMAQGPDGAFYLTDWVFSSYPIHGRGRLWKLEIEKQPWIAKKQPETPEAALAKELREGRETPEVAELLQLARGSDKYLADAALTALSRSKLSIEAVKALTPQDRVWAFVAMRRADLSDAKWVRAFFDDSDSEMRFECLRWIADAVLKNFQPQVEAMLSDSKLDFRLFEAVLATWNTLRGEPGAGVTNPEVLVERITDPKTPARLKGYALRLAPPTHKALTLELLRDFANSDDEVLQLEAVRTLAARRASADIAADDKRSPQLRAEAILGTDDTALLQKLAQSDNAIIRDEAQRALPRSLTINRTAFDDTAAWLKLLEGQSDAETGRRIFFNSKVALCSSCHRHSGRGNVVGPDLTLIAQQGDRAAILRSILEPHREVAPQFYPSVVELKDGTTFTGILLRSSSTEVFRDLTGKEKSFPEADIVKRTELRTSLMPPGLVMSLTNEELRDLLAFLTAR
ncbi:MAG: c-type cytochrome [Prosthecobacter sp.]|jgi:putative membrane-bound dehydrogenase-like protein|uniref:PVC-type heme-binding CxxCH protein n=1 Tax=Prosthecobacter sp. TaxID=1965333 RepID=UPI001A04DA48|nr:PVC-type heme-binding CxxCH protein [Prosthecobacter sp.]MBE2285503.1 c-type cytochrome [Prosthecobacter sp.]